jgi:hypothetical protein
MIKHTITWPLSLMLLGLAGEAFAQTSAAAPDTAWPPPSPAAPMSVAWGAPAPDAPTRKWYGDQVLIGYGASDLLVAAGIISGGEAPGLALVGTGLVVQVFAAPIVHWSHGHVGRGFLSLGLNGGLPLAAASLGYLAGSAGSNDSDDFVIVDPSTSGAFFGFLTGMLVGRAIDVAVLSYDKVEEGSPARGRRAAPELTLAPIVGRGQTGLGVAGIF